MQYLWRATKRRTIKGGLPVFSLPFPCPQLGELEIIFMDNDYRSFDCSRVGKSMCQFVITVKLIVSVFPNREFNHFPSHTHTPMNEWLYQYYIQLINRIQSAIIYHNSFRVPVKTCSIRNTYFCPMSTLVLCQGYVIQYVVPMKLDIFGLPS